MEIYVDFTTWEWTAVLHSKKLVFDCILITESGNLIGTGASSLAGEEKEYRNEDRLTL